MQINETKITKHISDLKEEVSKKTKMIDNLNNESEIVKQTNQSLDEKIKELRSEVDKFKKKESTGGSNKNSDLVKNQGLNLGKSM